MICVSAARLPSIAGGVTQEQRVLRRACTEGGNWRGLQPERRVFGHYGKQVVNLLSGLAEFLKTPAGGPPMFSLLRKVGQKYTLYLWKARRLLSV